MEYVWYALGALALLIVAYLFRNGRRNADPLNRACAASICHILTGQAFSGKDHEELDGTPIEEKILAEFERHHRYRSQALHVASMVAPLLVRAGYPRPMARQLAMEVSGLAMRRPA